MQPWHPQQWEVLQQWPELSRRRSVSAVIRWQRSCASATSAPCLRVWRRRALRAAIEQLSPKLQYELVINRYPILATISCESDAALTPRELYVSHQQLLGTCTLDFGPRLGLDGYVFSIEIEQETPEMRGNSESRKPGA